MSNKYLKMTEIEWTKVSSNQTLWPFSPAMPTLWTWSGTALLECIRCLCGDRIPEVRGWRCGAVPARRHAFESAGFRVDPRSGDVLRDGSRRPISLHPKLVERSQFSRGAFSFDLGSCMEKEPTANQCTTADYCFSVRSLDSALLQPRDSRLLCLACNIRTSIRCIPSEFNSSDKGSREHDNAYDSSKSLAKHFGYDLKKGRMPTFSRRTVNVAVRQRVVTRTAVRTPVAEVKNKRKLPTSSIRLDVNRKPL